MKVLEISKEDLKNNLETIQNIIKEKSPSTNIIAVVKANRNGAWIRRIFKIFGRKWCKNFSSCKL